MIDKNKQFLSKNSSVLFATFSLWANRKRMPTNGSVEPMRDFLVPRIKKLLLIDQLVPGSEDVLPRFEEYSNGNKEYTLHKPSWILFLLYPFLKIFNYNGTQIVFKIRDFISVLSVLFIDSSKFDYFIGLESVNAIAGILLRKLGRVQIVVYYVSDYSPNRYTNKLLNAFYLYLDRYCATHADFIWDVSKAMQRARIIAGLDLQASIPVIHVPNGLYPEQIKSGKLTTKNAHLLIYMGTLGIENGPDVAIEALSLIKPKYPDVKLHIIGGTEKSFMWLKAIIEKYQVKDSVVFYGFIPNSTEMSKMIRQGAIGLAPYRSFEGSPRYYGDAGKIRAYCASGLPVVTSKVPPLGQEVAQKGGAVAVDDDAQSFAKAIVKIFSDSSLYSKMKKNSEDFARFNTWNNQFRIAFEEMSTYEKKYK